MRDLFTLVIVVSLLYVWGRWIGQALIAWRNRRAGRGGGQ